MVSASHLFEDDHEENLESRKSAYRRAGRGRRNGRAQVIAQSLIDEGANDSDLDLLDGILDCGWRHILHEVNRDDDDLPLTDADYEADFDLPYPAKQDDQQARLCKPMRLVVMRLMYKEILLVLQQ